MTTIESHFQVKEDISLSRESKKPFLLSYQNSLEPYSPVQLDNSELDMKTRKRTPRQTAGPPSPPSTVNQSAAQSATSRRKESNNKDWFSNNNSSQGLRLLFLSSLTDHGGSPSQGCLGALKEVIGGGHSLVRHLEAGMDINPSRDNHPRMGFDGLHTSWHNQVFPYLPK